MRCKLVSEKHNHYEYLHFEEQGFSCKIIPELGGSLQELIINNKPVLWGCTPDLEGKARYTEFCNSGWLFPFPNRIENGNYSFKGSSYQLEKNELRTGNAIHGLVFDKPFEISEYRDDSAVLTYEYYGTHGFPFPFRFEVHYKITKRVIDIRVMATNTGKKEFPLGIGWHPYFIYSEEGVDTVNAKCRKQFQVDDKQIPRKAIEDELNSFVLRQGSFDDAFETADGEVVLNTSAYRLYLNSNVGKYLQLYTPKSEKVVAIEPMSCIANAFNNGIGIKSLAAGAQFESNFRISVEMI